MIDQRPGDRSPLADRIRSEERRRRVARVALWGGIATIPALVAVLLIALDLAEPLITAVLGL